VKEGFGTPGQNHRVAGFQLGQVDHPIRFEDLPGHFYPAERFTCIHRNGMVVLPECDGKALRGFPEPPSLRILSKVPVAGLSEIRTRPQGLFRSCRGQKLRFQEDPFPPEAPEPGESLQDFAHPGFQGGKVITSFPDENLLYISPFFPYAAASAAPAIRP